MSARPAPQPRRASSHRRPKVRLPRPDYFLLLLHPSSVWWSTRVRQRLPGYILALLISGVAAFLTLLLVWRFPVFNLEGVLLIVGIVAMALTWGTGPSLLATCVSTGLLAFVVLPPHFSWQLQDPTEWVDVVVLLLGGVGASLLAGKSAQARRRAEALAARLAEAKVRHDLERLRLRALVDALPVPVALLDAQEQMLEFNPALQTFLGVTCPPRVLADCPEAKAWWPATGRPVTPRAWPIARAALTGERVTNEEIELETAGGQRRVVLDSATPIRDERGVLQGAVGVFQDMTEHKRLEAALRQAEQDAEARARELEAIFEELTDGLLVYDAEGRILRSNTAARGIFGFEAHPEFAALPWQERASRYGSRDAEGQLVPPENLVLSRLLRGEVLTSAQAADQWLETPDGREVTCSFTGRPLRDPEGLLIGAVAIVRDVTERRRLEQRTHETLTALLAMAEALVETPDQTPDAARGTTPRADQVARRLAELTRHVLGCQYVSMAAVEPATQTLTPLTVVGLSPEEERQWWARWHPPLHFGDGLPPGAVAALWRGEPILLDTPQSLLPIRQRVLPERKAVLVPMRVGETLVGMLRVDSRAQGEDYTDQNKQALISAVTRLGALVLERERLLRERAEACASELAMRETTAQMDTFLGIAGHELKTPLTSISLALQLIERRISRQAQQELDTAHPLAPFLEQVARARQQAARLERLVNELLDVSRVRASKLELHLQSTDLAAIVREAVEEQRQANLERRLVFQLAPSRTVPVVADAERIGQVVTNYLTNALKYSPSDRPVVVVLDVDKGQARVGVRDEGPGLPSEEQERIWERFHRVKGIEVQSGTGVGLGLGLHISRTIIERHQGQVGVESTPGQGSTFWFTLPLGGEPEEGGSAPG